MKYENSNEWYERRESVTVLNEKSESKGLRLVLLILAAFFLFGVLSGLRASTSILVSCISGWTDMSYGTVSIAFSVMNIVLAISGPIFGLLTLKVHPSRIMIAGAIMGTIGFFGAATFTSSLPALIVFIGVFFGLGASALCYSIVYAAAVPVIGLKHSIVFGGILSASQGAVSMVFAPIIGFGSLEFGIQWCLTLVGIIVACLIPLCLLFFPRKAKNIEPTSVTVEKEENKPSVHTLGSIVKSPFFLMMACGMLTYGICDGGMINHLFEYTQMFHVSEISSAVMISVYSCASMIGALIGGFLSSHVQNRKLIITIIFSVWGVLNLVGYAVQPSYAIAITMFSAYGLGVGMSLPTFSAITQDHVSIEKFAVTFSLLYFFILFAYSMDSLAGGLLFDAFHNFISIDMVAVAFAFLTAFIFLVSSIKEKKGSRK